MKGHAGHCRDLLEQLSWYVDGDLGDLERRTVSLHLKQCPCCVEFVDSLRRTVSVCRDAGRRRLPGAVRARARARIADLLAVKTPGGKR
jgi:anti-sigma factor RsiW